MFNTKNFNLPKVVVYIFLTFLVILCLVPFVMMMINATRSGGDIIQGFTLIPGKHFFNNIDSLMETINIYKGFLNSTIIAVITTIITSYFSALTAFGFQFYEFKFKNALFVFILLMLMIPQQLGLLGYYELMFKLRLLDNYVALIAPSIANIAGVFFIRQYMASVIPVDLIAAARVDGCSEISIFHVMILPLSRSAIVTVAIMTFITSWNDYIRPLTLIFSASKRTLPVMIGSLQGAVVVQKNFGPMYAAISFSVIPIIIVFIIFSKQIVASVTAGSLKG